MDTIKNVLWDYENGDGGFLIFKNVVTIEFDQNTNEPSITQETSPQDYDGIRVFKTEKEAALQCFFAAIRDDAMLAHDWFEMVAGWGLNVSAENWLMRITECKPSETSLWDLKFTRVLYRASIGKRTHAFLKADPETSGIWRPAR